MPFPTEFDEDEVMPFRLIKDSKGGNILCVAIDGDFPKHVDTSADAFSEPYMVLNDWLGPEITSNVCSCWAIIRASLFDFLKTEQFKADFNQVIGHRGILSFMPNVGELFTNRKERCRHRVPHVGSGFLRLRLYGIGYCGSYSRAAKGDGEDFQVCLGYSGSGSPEA